MSWRRASEFSAGLAMASVLPTCGGGPSSDLPRTVVTSVRDAISVSVSEGATCVLHSDATVDCWGGVDASATVTAGPSPRRVGRTGVRQISMLDGVACLRDDVGSVWCWAPGHEGSPELVKGLNDIAQIFEPAIAIEKNGDVFYYCGLGGCPDPPLLVPWAKGASLAADGCAALATSTFPSGGHLQCAGPAGENAQSWFADRTVLALQGSPTNLYALLDDGSVFCSGNSTEYQCGHLGASDLRPVPGIPTSVALFAAYGAACAETRDGAVWCWGGPRALPVDRARATTCGSDKSWLLCTPPLEVPALRGAKHVALGSVWGRSHSCAIMSDLSLKCWGDNDVGQLGQ